MTRVFIDGSSGTTGLRIRQRISERQDISLLFLPEELRKDPDARKDMMNSADIVFLCLPDTAAREAACLPDDPETRIIDTSTAHRTSADWAYGFPELHGRRQAIIESKRVANPGCHASGFIALVAPLVECGLIRPDVRLSSFSLTGYSGGGKSMIAQYESDDADILLSGPRQYALSQNHKHLPEIVRQCRLEYAPVFCPVVADFYSGMEVTVTLFGDDLKGSPDDIRQVYRDYYRGGLVSIANSDSEGGFLSAAAFAGRDSMELSVCGNDERILLISRFDNLGKGASGAAIQNMNLLLGIEETTGLVL